MRADSEQTAPEAGLVHSEDEPLPQSPDFVPRVNPARPRALVLFALGALVSVLAMGHRGHSPFGMIAAASGVVVATFGLLEALGMFDDPVEPAHVVRGRELIRPLIACLLSGASFVVAVRLAVAGVLPQPIVSAAVLVTASALALVASGYSLVRRLGAGAGPDGSDAPLARPGTWLLTIGIGLYLPLLGSYSLIDPWETHYGEVAREMLARDDWISLWWAQEGWFFSKPVLDFWLQGLSFGLFGVRFQPDQMLQGAAEGRLPQPEWAARLPVIALTLVASHLAYRALARSHGQRAGLLGGLVLTTAPYWFFIAHQSMTDMPYVAPLTAALALVLLGLCTNRDALARVCVLRLGGRQLRLGLVHVVLGIVALTSLPQIFYLLSRHVSWAFRGIDAGMRFQVDTFLAGSGGGNCGLPGNEACRFVVPVNPVFQPALGALVWSAALLLFLYANRGERRLSRLYFLAAWYFAALAFLAKGAPGLVLPLIVAITAVCAAKRFADLRRLELPGLALLVACVALPWYVQAFMRHGSPFTDRLLFHDMYKRAFLHVHDTNAGDDVSFSYYLWQLGYGLFPWTGFAALGSLFWLQEGDEARTPRAMSGAFLGLWALLAFSLFTASLTKFHHYVLPAVPPLALLTGVLLDRLLPREAAATSPARRLMYFVVLSITATCAVVGTAQFSAGSFFGTAATVAPDASRASLGGALVVAAVVIAAVGCWRLGPAVDLVSEGREPPYQGAVLALATLFAAALVLLVGRDLIGDATGEGQPRLLNLFSYNYTRAWPRWLDFSAALRGFTLVFAAVSALAVLTRLRGHAIRLLLVTSIAFTAYALDVYFVRLAPHWGQRETLLTYYATRSGPEEPIVAFQMNWKGENFYTGNRLPAFVTTGAPFRDWITFQRERGVRVVYFTTEHSRVKTLKAELGTVKSFNVLTRPELNNKFMLARAEL